MRKYLFLIFLLHRIVFCNIADAQDSRMDRFVDELIKKMTLGEKLGQLNLITLGYGPLTGAATTSGPMQKVKNGQVGAILGTSGPATVRKVQEAALNSRLKIPLIFGLDVIHGHKTIFPIPLALSCTWDPAMVERSARIAATEASADGLNWVYSPMVDIARDPRWGRVAEGAGEDPYLGSLMATAMVRGYQAPGFKDSTGVMACVKHFALYGAAEAGRDYNSVDMSLLKMYQDYLPPYKAAVEAGVGSVMTSFNDINGTPATANHWLLTDLLRKQWGFKGFVVTDYTAINELSNHGLGNLKQVTAIALKAGVDMDMVGEGMVNTLATSLKEGKVTQEEIDMACRRVLEAKFKMGLFEDPYRHINEARATRELVKPENLAFAREVAKHSIVLLKNQNHLLPLKKSGTIAVVGPLADSPGDILGTWVIVPDSSKIVPILQGIKTAVGNNATILYAKGANFTNDSVLSRAARFLRGSASGQSQEEIEKTSRQMLSEALEVTSKADVIVAVLGEQAAWSGEASSRSDIGIPESQRTLLTKLLETGKPVVLVLVNGRPMTLEWEDTHVPAILEVWNGGTEAGNATADVLFGDFNPSGKLTMTFPRTVGQIPIYYNHKNTGRPLDPKNKFTSKYLDVSNEPLYPFGYGLSYTNFEYGDPVVSKTSLTGNETLKVTTILSNSGKYAGEEVVQLYVRDPVASITRPVKELKKFSKVTLQPGEKKEVSFTIGQDDLKFWNADLKQVFEPGEFIICVGSNSRDVKEVKVNWR